MLKQRIITALLLLAVALPAFMVNAFEAVKGKDWRCCWVRYEQQPGVGLAVRKYVLKRRGILSSDAMRKPATPLTALGRAEVDYLLDRLARRDPRAICKG
jgi:dihydrodipicolinate synthase/N-acetylneuraminate lyase